MNLIDQEDRIWYSPFSKKNNLIQQSMCSFHQKAIFLPLLIRLDILSDSK